MMFGIPAACLAMYRAIPKANRKKNGGLYFSGALTSFLTGITEPVEYTFLFVAPWLYVIHAFLDGCSFFVADILNIRIGNSFSGGLIDFLLFGVLQGEAKTNWLKVIPVGIVWALVYYFVFSFAIRKFKVAIPGMEDDIVTDAAAMPKTTGKKSTLNDEAQIIIEALGGDANIETVAACATRLRVAVTDGKLVDQAPIKQLGATAVFEVNGGIQAVFGGKADLLSQEINQILGRDD
jgi:PTS system glucose-specific IIC component